MPPFPQPFTSTTSHWQATNRGPTALWNHGRDAPLPSSADIVVIGAGITGASLAYQLTRPGGAGEGKRVVVLEARDVASGASESAPPPRRLRDGYKLTSSGQERRPYRTSVACGLCQPRAAG